MWTYVEFSVEVPPPSFDYRKNVYEKWKQVFEIWTYATDVDKEKQGEVLIHHLDDNTREKVLHSITKEQYSSAEGMNIVLNKLDELFKTSQDRHLGRSSQPEKPIGLSQKKTEAESFLCPLRMVALSSPEYLQQNYEEQHSDSESGSLTEPDNKLNSASLIDVDVSKDSVKDRHSSFNLGKYRGSEEYKKDVLLHSSANSNIIKDPLLTSEIISVHHLGEDIDQIFKNEKKQNEEKAASLSSSNYNSKPLLDSCNDRYEIAQNRISVLKVQHKSSIECKSHDSVDSYKHKLLHHTDEDKLKNINPNIQKVH